VDLILQIGERVTSVRGDNSKLFLLKSELIVQVGMSYGKIL
jgi:hypothetical protein